MCVSVCVCACAPVCLFFGQPRVVPDSLRCVLYARFIMHVLVRLVRTIHLMLLLQRPLLLLLLLHGCRYRFTAW